FSIDEISLSTIAFISYSLHRKNFKALRDCLGYNDKLPAHECQTRRARLVGASKECFLEKTAKICYNSSSKRGEAVLSLAQHE
ncbi:hypothetical protein KAS10_00230, partial [Candidatus Aerophobetes bacterium]|nr:hypothetical protein [Candidatus Aerophobetes bacterium]